jgi:anthranilate phosphoribosyltransferase
VVHAADGLDEISLAGPTHVAEFVDGEVRDYTIEPAALGVDQRTLEGLEVDGATDSLALIRQALGAPDDRSAEARKAADIVALNAGAALYVAGLADDLASGVTRARTVIDEGEALARLEALAELSQSLD